MEIFRIHQHLQISCGKLKKHLQRPDLMVLLLLTKYSELINHDFVESYGTLINENDMLKKNQGKLEVEQKELENQNLNLLLKNCAV